MSSRCEPSDLPVPLFQAVFKAIMETVGATLPELDNLRNDAIATPEIRQGYLALLELAFDLIQFHVENLARIDNVALVGNPGTELAAMGSAEKIF